jgi:hypothetical protein
MRWHLPLHDCPSAMIDFAVSRSGKILRGGRSWHTNRTLQDSCPTGTGGMGEIARYIFDGEHKWVKKIGVALTWIMRIEESIVGTLLVGGDGADVRSNTAGMLVENPHIKFFNGQCGYVRCSMALS